MIVKYFICLLFIATDISQIYCQLMPEDSSTEHPTLHSWLSGSETKIQNGRRQQNGGGLTDLINRTAKASYELNDYLDTNYELFSPITSAINAINTLINHMDESINQTTAAYDVNNYVNSPNNFTINSTEPMINVNHSSDKVINRLMDAQTVTEDPISAQMKPRPVVQLIDLINGTKSPLMINGTINEVNDEDFLEYDEKELWLKTINELEKINEGLNRYNTTLIRTKRGPVNGTVNGTVNGSIVEQLINRKNKRTNREVYKMVDRPDKMADRVDKMADRVDKMADEGFFLIRESVARRLGLNLRDKKYNNLAELYADYMERQNGGDEDDDEDFYSY